VTKSNLTIYFAYCRWAKSTDTVGDYNYSYFKTTVPNLMGILTNV